VFEKKILEKMEKKSAELILEAMRAGPTHLARLRHPRLLVVQHPLEESRYMKFNLRILYVIYEILMLY
jgi:SCY1-like protein 2